jgi:thiamine-monophosphate kinase
VKSEFEFIHYIKKSYGLTAIGDDCAVLPKDGIFDLLVTVDLLVEDIDFKLEWTRPESLGHKALAVSLSDIAAMGGRPKWAMLSIGVPEKLWESDFVKRFYKGWNELGAEHGVELVGGDISCAPGKLVIDSIVGGQVPIGKAVLRSGARSGDAIFVSGSLGGAAGGLRLLERSSEPETDPEMQKLIERQLSPTPRVILGDWLRKHEIASAMIDLSDGLSSDIHQVCEMSGVGAEIDADLLPIDKNLQKLFGADERLALALNGGEDFELLFTVPPEKISLLENADASRIGRVTENSGVIQLRDGDQTTDLHPSGYRHF